MCSIYIIYLLQSAVIGIFQASGNIKEPTVVRRHISPNLLPLFQCFIFLFLFYFVDEQKLSITPALEAKYNVTTMFKTAEEFFMSIGWRKLPKQFWRKSMLVKPKGLNVTCHASAWDFGVKNGPDNEEDVRYVCNCIKLFINSFLLT